MTGRRFAGLPVMLLAGLLMVAFLAWRQRVRPAPLLQSACSAASSPRQIVSQFYAALNNRRFAAAYACLSPSLQRQWSFAWWKTAYRHTRRTELLQASGTEHGLSSAVAVTLAALDVTEKTATRSTYAGTWHVDSSLRLSAPAISQLDSSSWPVSTSGAPGSWVTHSVMLSVYGRGFGIAPILGALGMIKDPDAMVTKIQPWFESIQAVSGDTTVRPAIHLIYGMATPCGETPTCLSYLDDLGIDIVHDYILPAAAHGWLVVLDDQLGRSSPAMEVRRMIARGYLSYDNVELAIDPEFRSGSQQQVPGEPIGSVSAYEINAAQALLSRAVHQEHLPHKKMLLVHEFRPWMINDPSVLHAADTGCDLVLVADGFGSPSAKAHTYSALFGGGRLPIGAHAGVKLFLPNPYERAGHGDQPVMTWEQVMRRAPVIDPANGQVYRLEPVPAVVVIA